MDANRTPSTATQRTVPFFNYPSVYAEDEQAILRLVADVGGRGAFIMQKDLAAFERRVAEYVGAKHVVGMANATDALHFAVRAAGIGPGDEVIFASHTMVATPAAAHFAGATPVPVECGPDHLICPAAVEAAVTPRTRAIMPTQLNGRTADMDALNEIAQRHGLVIIEDSAQALGSKYKGRCAGTFGLAGCISFYPAKTLGCLGDGGCLITNDDAVYEQVMLLRDHGRDAAGEVVTWGLNSRLDNLQAAILNLKMDRYERDVARRRQIAGMYDAGLRGVDALTLPPAPGSDPDHFDIFQNYELEAEGRDGLRDHLKRCGVGTLIQWGGKGVHQFEKLGFTESLPYTERLFERMLLLPLNPSLCDADVQHVADSVASYYGAAAGDCRQAA
ncbi:MAG: DegT/DnrJ/EryC1/StrS family aminotransferase [Planctomycetota bacterium]